MRYKEFKLPLARFCLPNVNYAPLYDAIERLNQINWDAQMLVRGFLIYRFQNNQKLPPINTNLYTTAINLVVEKSSSGRPVCNPDRLTWTSIMEDYLKKQFSPKVKNLAITSKKHLGNALVQLAKQMNTCQQTNIKTHYLTYIHQFVNQQIKYWKKHESDKFPFTGEEWIAQRNLLKKDLIMGSEEADPKFNSWIKKWSSLIFPENMVSKGYEYYYHYLDSQPHLFLPGMLFISQELEKMEAKTFQPICLRSNIGDAYMSLDTASMMDIMISLDEKLENYSFCKAESLKESAKFKHTFWKAYFKIPKKLCKNYQFNCEIRTDGYGVSLNLIHKHDLTLHSQIQAKKQEGRRLAKNLSDEEKIKRKEELEKEKLLARQKAKEARKEQRAKENAMKPEDLQKLLLEREMKKECPYIGKLVQIKEYQQALQEKYDQNSLVVIDPGRTTIMEMRSSKGETFSYSRKMRKENSRMNKLRKSHQNWKARTIFGDKTVLKRIAKLAEYSGKTVNHRKFLEFCRLKNQFRNEARTGTDVVKYQRKQRWWGFINLKRHENRLQDQLKRTFGKEATYVLGDYSGKNSRIKGDRGPILGLRKLLNGINHQPGKLPNVCLIDEFRTSSYHHEQGQIKNLVSRDQERLKVAKKRAIQNKKHDPNTDYTCKIHSVLTFLTDSQSKGCINRDKHATQNMLRIVESLLKTGERPEMFSRKSAKVTSARSKSAKRVKEVRPRGV